MSWRQSGLICESLLTNLSANRMQQGFTPSQTATFIFSLKQPVFERLKEGVWTGRREPRS